MKKAAAYLALAAGAIAFASAVQEYRAFGYFAAAAIVLIGLFVLFRPHTPTKAETIAQFESLKREQARLTDLQEKARQERWSADAQASVARNLAEVERRLAVYH
jgi:cytochrome c biogenesis protein CcdA